MEIKFCYNGNSISKESIHIKSEFNKGMKLKFLLNDKIIDEFSVRSIYIWKGSSIMFYTPLDTPSSENEYTIPYEYSTLMNIVLSDL